MRKPGPTASVAVTLSTAAVAPTGTRVVPATWTSIVWRVPTGVPAMRVSRTRSGTTVKSRALPPGPNQPKTSTITLTLALAKMRIRPSVPIFATTVFGDGDPGGKFTLDVPGCGPPSGKIVRNPGAWPSTAVTFSATASAVSGTSPPVTLTLIDCRPGTIDSVDRPSESPAVVACRRVSSSRFGVIGCNGPIGFDETPFAWRNTPESRMPSLVSAMTRRNVFGDAGIDRGTTCQDHGEAVELGVVGRRLVRDVEQRVAARIDGVDRDRVGRCPA